ncbi:hypothetical protein M3S_K05, partial (mitochondrion) [Sorghum bicolor]
LLGIEVTSTSSGILLTQQYLINLLKKANMLTAKPMNTPLKTNLQLSRIPLINPSLYRSIVGAASDPP